MQKNRAKDQQSVAELCPKNPTHRQRGQLIKEIIELLLKEPEITINQMATLLNCGHENIRRRYGAIKKQPEKYADLANCDVKDLKNVLFIREWDSGTGKGLQKRSSWPAWKVAPKIDTSDFRDRKLKRLTKDDKIAIYANKHILDEV